MLLGFSVSESMLALCVPNHINYLSGCGSPPLGICCTSLSKYPGSGRTWVLICASTAYGGPLWSCSDDSLSVSSSAVPSGVAPVALGGVARTAQDRHKGSFSGALELLRHILVSEDGHWAALESLTEASMIIVEVLSDLVHKALAGKLNLQHYSALTHGGLEMVI